MIVVEMLGKLVEPNVCFIIRTHVLLSVYH